MLGAPASAPADRPARLGCRVLRTLDPMMLRKLLFDGPGEWWAWLRTLLSIRRLPETRLRHQSSMPSQGIYRGGGPGSVSGAPAAASPRAPSPPPRRLPRFDRGAGGARSGGR